MSTDTYEGGEKRDAAGASKVPKLKFKTLLESPNIATHMTQEYRDVLGSQVVDGYRADRSSRKGWEQKNAAAIKLALQVVESKSFPWANCSNVKFPIVTIAALQFLSRVAILTKGRQIAKCDVLGADPEGTEGKRANRIASHLSFQLLEEDENWLDDDEKAKFAASIVGCAFKKTFFDPVGGTNQSPHIPAAFFVVDYYTKDIDKAQRATHMIPMSSNDLKERERRGIFLKITDDRASIEPDELEEQSDAIAGIGEPGDDSIMPTMVLEQHCWIDLDGDGYQEPYIVSVVAETGETLRVVARYYDQGDVYRKNDSLIRKLETDMRKPDQSPETVKMYKDKIAALQDADGNHILRIEPLQAFTKIPFIPSPDGGFYDLGLGSLLGPMNAAVDSIVNQLIDSGTMQNTAGGFLGRGVKIKGGSSGFSPFEWKPVDSNGDDLRKNIVPLPVTAPSNVLFELLNLLIGYSERISGSTDIMSGISPGQNTPAETSRNTIEQGMKIFSGIYARMHRAFRRELKKYVALNQLFLEDSHDFYDLTTGAGAMIARDDYTKGKFSVRPSADPATASETQRQQKAQMLAERAAMTHGYDTYQVELNLLEAFDVPNIATLYPDPQGPHAIPAGTDPKMDLEKAKLDQAAAFKQQDMELAGASLQVEIEKVNAQIIELQARANSEVADANSVETGHQLAAIANQIGAAKLHQDGLLQAQKMILDFTKEKAKIEAASAKPAAKAAPSKK